MNMKATLLAATILLAFTALAAGAETNRNWMDLGESGLGPWHVYVDTNSIRKDDRGHYHVHVLDDHRVTQSGVDRYDDQGNYYRDKNFPHKSTVTHYVLDCKEKMEVSLSISYFEGVMATGDLVLFERENDPFWMDILAFAEPKIFEHVCK